MEVKVSRSRVLEFIKERGSGKVNRGSGVTIKVMVWGKWRGKQKNSVRRKHQGHKKCLVGQQRQANSMARAPYLQPILMGNSDNGSAGNSEWRQSPRGHQGNRKEKKPYFHLTLTGNSQIISVEQRRGQPDPRGAIYRVPYWQ